jgi:UDP-N-acetylglucosamine 2-epimerase (non-hydrolysing)/UDP-GlcNAc3NAcA epimerase
MKILSIVGARPQFIKAAPVSRALRRIARAVLVHTGQHYDPDMSQIFFDELHIPKPDYNLGVGSGSHGWQTGQMLMHIEDVLLQEQPDWVLVYGDTNSTLAGALAAAKLYIPVAHVEAGLRSFNRAMPEEHNRVLTDHTAHLLFCPTQQAVELLSREGITAGVHLTGDVMYDAYLYNAQLAEQRSTILSKLGVDPKTYALATVHRPANTDDSDHLRNVLDTLASLETPVILPAHPRTRQAMKQMGYEPGGNLRVVEPVSYLDMLMLERNALRIFTDSGGVQKEAYFAGVSCVTLREETEWTETLDAGWNVLVGAHPARILEAARTFQPPAEHPPLYGDGKASERIAAILQARPD